MKKLKGSLAGQHWASVAFGATIVGGIVLGAGVVVMSTLQESREDQLILLGIGVGAAQVAGIGVVFVVAEWLRQGWQEWRRSPDSAVTPDTA